MTYIVGALFVVAVVVFYVWLSISDEDVSDLV